MDCSDLDGATLEADGLLAEHDGVFAGGVAALVLASAALLSHGEFVVRPLAALAGGSAGAVGVYVLSGQVAPEPPCTARLTTAGVAGATLAVLTLCLLRRGVFLLGALGMGLSAHFVYEALGLDAVAAPFDVGGRSGWYAASVTGAAAAGAAASRLQRREFVCNISSLLGASGLALAVHLSAARAGAEVPPVATLALVTAATGGGVAAQAMLRRRRTRRASSAGVPVGTPVA